MMSEINYLKNKFNDEVIVAVEEIKKIGYVPTRFIQMLQQQGNNAYEVVQRLVAKDASSGLEKLWEKGRLDLSMEALMVKPEYRELFPEEILNICNKKLKKYGYRIKGE